MYCTISMIDGFPEYAEHASLAEAEAFAAEVSGQGFSCRLMLLLREYRAEDMFPCPLGAIHALPLTAHTEACGW